MEIIESSEKQREEKEPKCRSEAGIKAFVIVMTAITILTAALTSVNLH